MVNVLEYFDYQLFLRDFIENCKKEKPWFSYRYLESKTSIDHSNLVKITQGKRHASKANVSSLCEALKFNQKETEYFKTLVEFNKSKNQAKSKVLLEKLIALKNVTLKTLEPHQYDYYRQWYHTAVYSLLDFYEFRGDYAALAEAVDPPITPKQAKETIALLEKLQLIHKEPDGRYVQTQKLISTGAKWRSIAIQNFQEETMKLAINSLYRQPQNVRNISTLTMALTKDEMIAIHELTEQYRKSIIKVVNEGGKGDTVYQLNIQLFPLTKSKWSIS
jgi:uncharacterized protein (TIGR02147 family)